MPKMKTNKLVAKRIKKTKSGKLMKKTAGQSHYNARENGKTGRTKKRNKSISSTEERTINQLMPY